MDMFAHWTPPHDREVGGRSVDWTLSQTRPDDAADVVIPHREPRTEPLLPSDSSQIRSANATGRPVWGGRRVASLLC